MSTNKLVTVYGASGAQGGSVVGSLLQNKSDGFSLRAITRNPSSQKARELAAQGVEVVKANGFHRDQILEAFRGSWAVFVNTNTADPALHRPGGLSESGLGKLLVDAAFEAGVQHFVYSGLASAKVISNGAVPSEGFDEKCAVSEYAKNRGFKSVTIVSASWYMENNLNRELVAVMGGFPFDVDDEGYLTFRIPRWGGTDEIPFVSMEDDWGDLVHGILLDPERYDGHFVHGISDWAKPEEMVSIFQSITGKRSRYVPIDWRSIDAKGDPELETVKTMFGFLQCSGGRYFGEADDIEPARELKARATAAKGLSREEGTLMTLDRWLRKHYS